MPVYISSDEAAIRHHEVTCPKLRAEIAELHPEADDKALDALAKAGYRQNREPLRLRTERCSPGCFREYEKDEREAILTDTAKRGRDPAYHAASVVNDAGTRTRNAVKKAAAKRGISLEDRAKAALERQKRAVS